MTEPDYKKILLNLLASLTLCDHMGDVSNDMLEALKQTNLKVPDDDDDEWPDAIRRYLHSLGATTLYGTSIGEDE